MTAPETVANTQEPNAVSVGSLDLFADFRVCNETRARFRCGWCGHSFEASATEFSRCPKCESSMHANSKCEVCGIVFRDGTSGEGGRPASVCSTRCRVRKHRVTKRGLYSVNKADMGKCG
jgi:hypothetical protein